MITEQMTAADICAEFKKDLPHVTHALHKSYGGRRKYEADLDRMAQDVLRAPDGTIMLGNVETYHSGFTGNNWMVYSFAENTGFKQARVGHRSFVWWNTDDGSIASLQTSDPTYSLAASVLIYSGHFFKRYAEREQLGEVDLQLVCEFMRQNYNGVFQCDDKPQDIGRYRFDIITQRGIGRGFTSGFDPINLKQPFISHVKTYLPNSMLTPKQRNDTAESRNIQALKSRPADAFVTMMLGDNPDMLPDFFADVFLSRGQSDAMGRSFLHMIENIISYEIQMRGTTKDDMRATMLQLFHLYQQSVFEYVSARPRVDFSLKEVVSVAMMGNPELDVEGMLALMLELPRDNPNIVKQADILKSAFQYLCQRGDIPQGGYH